MYTIARWSAPFNVVINIVSSLLNFQFHHFLRLCCATFRFHASFWWSPLSPWDRWQDVAWQHPSQSRDGCWFWLFSAPLWIQERSARGRGRAQLCSADLYYGHGIPYSNRGFGTCRVPSFLGTEHCDKPTNLPLTQLGQFLFTPCISQKRICRINILNFTSFNHF